MKLDSLKLRNYRGIQELNLQFPKTQTVALVGANGSGKTAVLDGIAVLLSRFVARVRSSDERGRQFREEDISNEAREMTMALGVDHEGKTYAWSGGRARSGKAGRNGHDLQSLKVLAEELRSRLQDDPGQSLPLVIYYPVHRAVLDIPLRIRKRHTFDQMAAVQDALGGKATGQGGKGASVNFRLFFEWFREREDYENELRIDKPSYRDPQLEAVRSSITNLLPGFSGLRVRRRPRLRMTLSKEGRDVAVDQLSDGEKCLLALAGDLARRLALANPGAENPLRGSGIIMIDEVELHLHPGWQRGIVPALERTFPKCQFLVTTHSMAVLSHLDPEAVFLFKRSGECVEVLQRTTQGQDVNRIIEDVFDVPARPLEYENRLKELFASIGQGRLDHAREMHSWLESQLGSLEPELVRAGALIRRRDILGR